MPQIHPARGKNAIKFSQIKTALSVAVLSSMLVACGGGGSGGSSNAITSSTTSGNTSTTTNTTNTSTTTSTTTLPPVTTTPITSPSSLTDTSTTTPTTTEDQLVFNALNIRRSQCGFRNLTYSTELAKAASNHANYLTYVSAQNKIAFASHDEGEMSNNGVIIPYTSAITNPYYSGSAIKNRVATTANTLGTKAQVVNYGNSTFNEDLSVMTTSTSGNTIDSQATANLMISGLLAAPYHMRGLLDTNVSQVGINYQQTGWKDNLNNTFISTLEIVSALPATSTASVNTKLLNYPCDGMKNTEYQLDNESPNPIPNRDLETSPIGQPIYILAPSDKTIASVDATVMTGNTNVGKMNILTQATDPNKQLNANEAFVLPDSPLKPSTTYQVSYTLHYSTGETTQNSFSFTTRSL